MTAPEELVVQTYRCPDCEGSLSFERRSWQCADCGHVPRHAAD